jgi:hypothetical protein
MKMLKMKNIYLLTLAATLFATSGLFVSCGPTQVIQQDSYAPAPAPAVEEVSYQSFYDQLSPYGNWINYPGYGYVWMPNAGPDFRPYSTNGNWIYTDAGWTWASNYNWGWAPFHYGRWFLDNNYGWMWIPGNEWAPAWVTWRGNSEYYGWAPLGPHVSAEMAMGNYNPPVNYWNFVPTHYMGNPGWHNYYVNENRNVTIINNTTIINNYSGTNRNRYAYAPGPDPNEVRRYSGNNFQTVQVREANTPGERYTGSQYTVYRPSVNANPSRANTGARPAAPAPARYQPYNGQRPATNNQLPVQQNQLSQPNQQNQQNRPNKPNPQPKPAVQPPVNNPNYPNYNGQRPTGTGQPSSTGRPVEQSSGSRPANEPADHYKPQAEPANPANRSPNNQPQQIQRLPTIQEHPATSSQPSAAQQKPPVQQHPTAQHPQSGNGQRSAASETRPVEKPVPAQPQTQTTPQEKPKTREPQ